MFELYDRIKLQLLLCHIAYTPCMAWLQMNGRVGRLTSKPVKSIWLMQIC